MVLGICNLALVPLRASASHRSEMVNQILFGEFFEILAEEREWTFIRMLETNYEGYLQVGQYQIWTDAPVSPEEGNNSVVDLLGGIAVQAGKQIKLVPGTKVHAAFLNGEASTFDVAIDARLRKASLLDFDVEFPKLVNYYLASPYLWGGRSAYGIDCSGLTQAIYAHFGLSLPRDAYQQAEQGRVVDFLPEIKAGDLAFFDNEEGRITHVGIMIDSENILHASAAVKIDKLDTEGIFHQATSRYTHKLRIVKRYF